MSILTQSADLLRKAARRALANDCLLCAGTAGAGVVCAACAGDLPRLPSARCPQCALPTPLGERCGQCLRKAPHFDATLAVFAYAFPLDKLVQSFKYGHRLALGRWFGERLAELADGYAADRIVPLPLHRLRLRERGFNQALELARAVHARGGIPLDYRGCRRIRHTPAQAGLPWRERGKNIRGAFHCESDLSGQRILLVDDVMTTGASLNECARTLKLHGAAEVTLLVVARALP